MALSLNKSNPLIEKIRSDGVIGGGTQDRLRSSMNSTFGNLRAPTGGYETPGPGGMPGQDVFSSGLSPAPTVPVAAPPSPLDTATGNIFGGRISPSERNAALTASVPEQVAGVISGLDDTARVANFQQRLMDAGITSENMAQNRGAVQAIYRNVFSEGLPAGAPSSASGLPSGVPVTAYAPTGLRQRAIEAAGRGVFGQGDVAASYNGLNAQGGQRFSLGQITPVNGTTGPINPNPAMQIAPTGVAPVRPASRDVYAENSKAFKERLVEEQQRKALNAGLAKNYVIDPADPTRVRPLAGSIEEVQLQKLKQELEAGKVATAEKEAKSTERKRQTVESATRVLTNIDRVLPKISAKTTGWGSFLSSIPGSEAKDVEADIKSINAALGLDTMLALKEASQSGSTGMGNQTEREFENMVVAKSNLDRAQSPDQVRANLNAIKTSYDRLTKMAQGINPYEATGSVLSPEKQKRLQELRAKLGK